jgi:hypothetical protein
LEILAALPQPYMNTADDELRAFAIHSSRRFGEVRICQSDAAGEVSGPAAEANASVGTTIDRVTRAMDPARSYNRRSRPRIDPHVFPPTVTLVNIELHFFTIDPHALPGDAHFFQSTCISFNRSALFYHRLAHLHRRLSR